MRPYLYGGRILCNVTYVHWVTLLSSNPSVVTWILDIAIFPSNKLAEGHAKWLNGGVVVYELSDFDTNVFFLIPLLKEIFKNKSH